MKKILVIDDDQEMCDLLKQILASRNHCVTSVSSATDGLMQMKSTPYDLIMLDMHLPDGNGIDLLPKFKCTRNIPVIIMTSFGTWQNHIRSYQLGAYYFLDKPFRISFLKNLVEQALQF